MLLCPNEIVSTGGCNCDANLKITAYDCGLAPGRPGAIMSFFLRVSSSAKR